MKKVYDEVSEMLAALEPAVEAAMKSGAVEAAVIEVFQASLDETVYSKYKPEMYERRYDSPGGLRAKSSIKYTVKGLGAELEDVATGNPRYDPHDTEHIDYYIERGLYFYRKPNKARPIYEPADEELTNSARVDKAMEAELEAKF